MMESSQSILCKHIFDISIYFIRKCAAKRRVTESQKGKVVSSSVRPGHVQGFGDL